MIEVIYTIGGYGHSKESFFKKLKDNGVDILVDIRQRRGMRGKLYSFLNSSALQNELFEQGISYIHIKDLAPTNEVRSAQKEEDKKTGDKKRSRTELSDSFKKEYQERVLLNSDVNEILAEIQPYRRPCLFCVEGPAKACHRSLVAEWILSNKNYPINDITVS
jgi:uncharacterized protein (DUF488 family)